MSRRAWTPTEDAILERNYPRAGSAGVHRNLRRHGYRRTRDAIRERARRLAIYQGDLPGLVPASWIASQPRSGALNHVIATAKRDGVLHTIEGGKVRHLVPLEWADAFVNDREERVANTEELQDWWTIARIATELGTSEASVRRMLARGPLARAFDGVEVRHAYKPRRKLLEPTAAAAAVRTYLAHRSAPTEPTAPHDAAPPAPASVTSDPAARRHRSASRHPARSPRPDLAEAS